MAEKRLFKEYNLLQKNPVHEVNPQIVSLLPVDLSNIRGWEAIVSKPGRIESRYYYNGKWKLNIEVPATYPITPPKIEFDRSTPICHPNISIDTGEICLDILKQENWSPAWNLQYLLVAILMLIDDPEPDSPLNIDLANLFRHDKTAFESVVQYYMWKYGTFFTASDGEKDTTGVKSRDDETNAVGVEAADDEIDDKDLDADTQDVSNDASKTIHEIKNQAQEIVNDTNSILGDSSPNEQNHTFSYRLPRPVIPSNTQNDIKSKLDLKLNNIDSLKENLNVTEASVSNTTQQQVPNYKIIHDVGEEVTKQFIAKVDEIGHSSSSSQGSIDQSRPDDDLQGVKQKVTQNVTKQVEILCLKSASPDNSELHEGLRDTNRGAVNGDLEKVRQNFMKQVDEKIKKHERYIRKQQYSSPIQGTPVDNNGNTKSTTSTPATSVSSNKTANGLEKPGQKMSATSEPGPAPEVNYSAHNEPRWAKNIQNQRLEAEQNSESQPRKKTSSSVGLSTTPRSTSSQELDVAEADTSLQRTDSSSSSKSQSFSTLRRSLSRKNSKAAKASTQDDRELSKRKRLLNLLKSKPVEK